MSDPRRRQKFVDAKVQGALARRLIFHWLAFFVVATLVALVLEVMTNPLRPAGAHLRDTWSTYGLFLVVMLFLLPVFVMDTIKLSHRFAGPIVGLRRAMRDVAQGARPRKLKFRRGDFWHELAEDYNAMLGRLVPGLDDPQDDKPTDDETTAADPLAASTNLPSS